MSNIDNVNEPTQFPDDESLMETLFATKHYIPLENQDELEVYMAYLSYRVQQDLYEVLKASGVTKKKTLKEFIQFLCSRGKKQRTQETAFMVALLTLKNFLKKSHFNFGVTEARLPIIEDTTLQLVKLFYSEAGRAYVETILIRAELAQYKRQLSLGKEYSWKEFVAELAANKPLWDETLMAFRDALLHLDFKPAAQYAIK